MTRILLIIIPIIIKILDQCEPKIVCQNSKTQLVPERKKVLIVKHFLFMLKQKHIHCTCIQFKFGGASFIKVQLLALGILN